MATTTTVAILTILTTCSNHKKENTESELGARLIYWRLRITHSRSLLVRGAVLYHQAATVTGAPRPQRARHCWLRPWWLWRAACCSWLLWLWWLLVRLLAVRRPRPRTRHHQPPGRPPARKEVPRPPRHDSKKIGGGSGSSH